MNGKDSLERNNKVGMPAVLKVESIPEATTMINPDAVLHTGGLYRSVNDFRFEGKTSPTIG